MRIFTSDVGAFCKNKKQVSASAYRLLEYAVMEEWGMACLEIARTRSGKPYFSGEENRFFSMSHTGTHILVGVSEGGLGVDIEAVRPLREGLAERIFSEHMRREFSFFEGWTLREAIFKLTGEGGLTSMELQKRDGIIITPFDSVKCRTYDSVAGCAAAVADYTGNFPEKIENIDPELFLS